MKYLETVATAQKRVDIFHVTAGSGDSHYCRPTGLKILEIHIPLPPQILRIKSCATRTSWSWGFIITIETLTETEIGTRSWDIAVTDLTMHL